MPCNVLLRMNKLLACMYCGVIYNFKIIRLLVMRVVFAVAIIGPQLATYERDTVATAQLAQTVQTRMVFDIVFYFVSVLRILLCYSAFWH